MGCNTSEKLWYFSKGELTSATMSYDPVIKPDDVLGVFVMSPEKDLVHPYNFDSRNIAGNQGGYSQGAPTPPGYYVDSSGFIEFPAIGKLKVGGLKRMDAARLIGQKLEPFLKDATVIIRIQNYKISVLGEVNNPGTFTIPNEKVTIVEAIGIAGDLLITGERASVTVFREMDGQRKEFSVDLTNRALFNSPVYYLEQNDVVYIKPNRAKRNGSVVNTNNGSLVISSIAILTSVLLLWMR